MVASHGVGTYGNAVGTVTPLDHKLGQAGLIAKSSGIAIRSGVFWGGVANLVVGKANMSYDVNAFDAALSRGAAAGAVLIANPGVYNVATIAAPGANSRYDVVYIWQREYSLDGVDSEPVIGVINGTAAASPSVPSLAAYPGAIALATILVPAGVTATNSGTTITQSFPITTADGGRLWFPDAAARDRSGLTPQPNDKCQLGSDGIEYIWDGTGWRPWEKAWTAWTPTLQNFPATNPLGTTGSATGAWCISGGRVQWWLALKWAGSSIAVPSTSWGFSLPYAIASAIANTINFHIGAGKFRDASVASSSSASANADIEVMYEASTNIAGFRQPYSGTSAVTDYGYVSAAQSGLPTEATGDYLTAQGEYPV